MRKCNCKGVITLLSVILTVYANSSAQIIDWALEPTYKNIELYHTDTYKVTDNLDKVSLMTDEGRRIYDPNAANGYGQTYDSITPVTNGYGLLIDYDFPKHAWRLKAIFDAANHTVTAIPEKDKFYLGDHAYFSENMLPVRKDNKKYGYISTAGIPATKFSYEIVFPFSEGKAAVSKDRKSFVYTDFFGNDNAVAPAAGKKFIICSTFYGGEASVVNSLGQAFRIDERLMPIATLDANSLELDASGVNFKQTPGSTIGMQEALIVDTDDYETFTLNGKTGYVKGGKIIVKPQFDAGDIVCNGTVPVKVGAETGLLRIMPDSLSITLATSENKVSADSLENLNLKYNVPVGTRDRIKLSDSDGKDILFSRLSNQELEFAIPKGKIVRLQIIGSHGLIKADTLLKTPSFLSLASLDDNDNSGIDIAVSPMSVTADAKKQATVAVKVTNTSTETKQLSVVISGTGIAGGGTFKVKLAPGKSKTYYPVITKIVRKEKRTITVTAGGKKVSRAIQVTPKAVKL